MLTCLDTDQQYLYKILEFRERLIHLIANQYCSLAGRKFIGIDDGEFFTLKRVVFPGQPILRPETTKVFQATPIRSPHDKK